MRAAIGYQHRLVVTRAASGGSQDPVTGQPTGGSETVIYDGKADVQDAGEARPRAVAGMPFLDADATVFLPEGQTEALLAIEVGDAVVVHYPGGERTADGEVLFVRELDEVLLVKFR